jgi:hypothetical protein
MHDILRLLDASARAAEDKRAFLKAQIVFWLPAATDGHAKNYSMDAVARQAGLGDATALLAETAGQTAQAIATVGRQMPRGFPARVQDRIFAGLLESARRLAASLPG